MPARTPSTLATAALAVALALAVCVVATGLRPLLPGVLDHLPVGTFRLPGMPWRLVLLAARVAILHGMRGWRLLAPSRSTPPLFLVVRLRRVLRRGRDAPAIASMVARHGPAPTSGAPP